MRKLSTFSCFAKCGESDNDKMLECGPGKHWLHYACTNIPNIDIAGEKAMNEFDYTCHFCASGIINLQSELKAKDDEIENLKKELFLVKKTNHDVVENESDLKSLSGDNIDVFQDANSQVPELHKHHKAGEAHENNRREKSQLKKRICHYLKVGKCSYGRGGSGCKFLHPQTCKPYLNQMCDGKCNLLHPKLCYGSVNKRECYNAECRFYHLPHTKRNSRAFQPWFKEKNRFDVLNSDPEYAGSHSNRNSFLVNGRKTDMNPHIRLKNLEEKFDQVMQLLQNNQTANTTKTTTHPNTMMMQPGQMNAGNHYQNQVHSENVTNQGFWTFPNPPPQ